MAPEGVAGVTVLSSSYSELVEQSEHRRGDTDLECGESTTASRVSLAPRSNILIDWRGLERVSRQFEQLDE